MRRARKAGLGLCWAGCLLLLLALLPDASSAAALRVSHRALHRSCRYATTHGSRRARARARRRCRAARRRRQQALDRARANSYQNPISTTSGDPTALNASGSGSDYYEYATGDFFPIQHSTDLVHWTTVGNALPSRPAWVVQTGEWHPWSPSVIQRPGSCPLTTSPSCFYLYYTGLSAQFSTNCVAVATSTTPFGPFTDQGPLSNGVLDGSGRPIGCGDDTGYGNIDPDPFIDTDGSGYLYVSTDFSCTAGSSSCAPPGGVLAPTISVIPLDSTLVQAAGPRMPLFGGDQPWEQAPWASVVEGPWMEKRGPVYHLFYSGGDWTGAYGTGDAVMSSPVGPASKDPSNPILRTSGQVFSPGGGSTIIGPHGSEWMLYHARVGSYTAPRQLFIDRVLWSPSNTVSIRGPTITRQSPAP